MARVSSIEREILGTGALQFGEYIAHNGESGNLKLVLDDLLNDDRYAPVRTKVVKRLAAKLKPYKPEIILPMPEGANGFGMSLARKLGARAVLLEWEDKEQGILTYKDQHERQVVCLATRIAKIDDVLRKGTTFEQAIDSLGLSHKELVAGVVWDRREESEISTPVFSFPVESVVQKYYPLRVDRLPG